MAYLILAHRDLEQLHSLVARLLREDPDDRVLIHFDRGSPIRDDDLRAFADGFGGAVALTPRIRCRWGHHSLVAAEWLLVDAARKLTVEQAHLLSGQDWPVAGKAAIVAASRIAACRYSYEEPALNERMDAYHFHDRLLGPNAHATAWRYHLDMKLRRAARLYTRVRGPRPCPLGPGWKKGSAWWSLPKPALDLVASRLGELIASGRLRHTLCSDEHATGTVLAYSPFAADIQDNRRFIKWQPSASSPAVLRACDIPAIRASNAWFARKVDRAVDPFFLKL